MLHRVTTIFILFILVSCGTSTTSEQTADSLSVDSAVQVPLYNVLPQEEFTADIMGIILDEDVPVWNDTARSEEYIAMLNTGEEVYLVNEYPGLVYPFPEDGASDCDKMGYHFYDIRFTIDGKEWEGVIFGEDLFLSPRAYQVFRGQTPTVINPQSLSIHGTDYEFDVVLSDGIGPSNADGLTGCDDTYIPYFRDVKTGKINFIRVTDEGALQEGGDSHMRMRNGILELVWGSEGGSCKIQSVEYGKCQGEETIVLELESGYQDGGASFTMCVTEADGQFNLLVVYKK